MICPHLGSFGDRDIRLRYPNYQNRCYAQGDSAAVDKAHQEQFCLSGNYQQCSRYSEANGDVAPSAQQPELIGESTEPGMQLARRGSVDAQNELSTQDGSVSEQENDAKQVVGNGWGRKLLLSVVILLLGLGLMSLLTIVMLNNSPEIFAALMSATDTPTMTSTSTATATLTASPTTTATSTATRTPTDVPTVTSTATPTASRTATSTSTPIYTDTPIPTDTPLPKNTPIVQPAQSAPERLVIPAINVDTKVIPMGWETKMVDGVKFTEWKVVDYAAGWHRNSALPGNGGNVVISGHNNIRGKVFKELYALEEGADVFLYVDGEEYHYQVVENLLLLDNYTVPLEQRLENNRYIEPMNDERLTLVSCWPYDTKGLGYTTHRVIVVTKLVVGDEGG